MLQRRTFLCGVASAAAAAGVTTMARAQRPAQPIARPPAQRLAGAIVKGRFDSGGVAGGAIPGVYEVVAVDTDEDTLNLRDETGRTALVHLSDRAFDLSTLEPGDEVQVDFLVPDPGSTRLEAGALWKVER